VKPYFLKVIQAKVGEEEQKVMDGIKAEVTASEILFFYLMNVNHPEVNVHHITQKFLQFNENRDRFNLNE
jgi:hypothetical protein